MGGHDGPSDEEGSDRSMPSYQYPYPYSNRSKQEYADDDESPAEHDVASPPPPPPPTSAPPPAESSSAGPPPPPPRQQHRSRSSRRHGKDKGGKSPRYPSTIEVISPRSGRAKQKIHADYSYSYESEPSEPTGSLPSASLPSITGGSVGDGGGMRVGRGGDYHSHSRGNSRDGNYESFPAPSINLDTSLESESLPISPQWKQHQQSPSPNKKQGGGRGQVLVHYHPQLGDEGYESTLLESQPQRPAEEKYSRVSRALNTATRRDRDADVHHRHKNAYPPKRAMHTRMIDDMREEEYSHHSPGRMRTSHNNNMMAEGNDEYNNAATRQIRRRVFRVAMERGMHDERIRKLLDADADVGGPSLRTNSAGAGGGGSESVNESGGPFSPGSTSVFSSRPSGYQIQTDRHTEEGDMPLTPGNPRTPKTPYSDTITEDSGGGGSISQKGSMESSLLSPLSPPSPPHHPPSYRTLVYNLISQNEPEKLAQIDRVMEKYAGREEELIQKLDMRYRRRRLRRELANESVDSKERRDMAMGLKDTNALQQPMLEDARGSRSLDGKPSLDGTSINSLSSKPMEIKTETLTSPSKLTFVKVQNSKKNSSAIMAMQSFDKSEGSEQQRAQDPQFMIAPPKIMKRPMPSAISDSTKTDLHTNAGAIDSMAMEDDDNSGMIPNPKVNANVQNLGNQVINEMMQREKEEVMKERLERGKVKEELIARATSIDKEVVAEKLTPERKVAVAGGDGGDAAAGGRGSGGGKDIGDTSSSPRLKDDYSLRMANSYGDGISVITMDTKESLFKRGTSGAAGAQRVGGDGEAVYSFDEMLKRPPNSITVESGSNSGGGGGNSNNIRGDTTGENVDGAAQQSDVPAKPPIPPKLQRLAPEVIETEDEKAKAAEESAETSAKLDDVEARIRARHRLREEEAKAKQVQEEEANKQVEKEYDDAGTDLMKAGDELDDLESLFKEAKSVRSKSSLAPEEPVQNDDAVPDTSQEKDHEETNNMLDHSFGQDTSYEEEAKGVLDHSFGMDTTLQTIEVISEDEGEEKETEVAEAPMIESILSSFDEGDAESFVGGKSKPQHTEPIEHGESELRTISSAIDDVIQQISMTMEDSNDDVENAQGIPSVDADTTPVVHNIPTPVEGDKDEGCEDNHTISTAGSRHSVAERAIAAATRSEIQRQKEVAEFQRSQHQLREAQSQSMRSSNNVNIVESGSGSVSAMGSVMNDNLEEEIARLIAEKESRFQAEKAVALMKAQRELEAERRARLEAEAARIKAEEELKRLKKDKEQELGEANISKDKVQGHPDEDKMPNKEESVEEYRSTMRGGTEEYRSTTQEDSHNSMPLATVAKLIPADDQHTIMSHQSEQSSVINARMEAEAARLKMEQELQRIKLEKMAVEAETERRRAEEDLERLKLEKAAKEAEAARIKAEEELERLKMGRNTTEEVVQVSESSSVPRMADKDTLAKDESDRKGPDQTYPSVNDHVARFDQQARLEAEAARLKAEKELQRLKSERALARAREDEEAEAARLKTEDLMRISEREDAVEKFRHAYSSDEEDDGNVHENDSKPKPSDADRAIPDDETDSGEQPQSEQVSQRSFGEAMSLLGRKLLRRDTSDAPNDETEHSTGAAEEDKSPDAPSTQTKDNVVDANEEDEGNPLETTPEPQNTASDSSPDLDEPPEITRTPEKEIEDVLSQGGSPQEVPQQTRRDSHDFASATMAHAPKLPLEHDAPAEKSKSPVDSSLGALEDFAPNPDDDEADTAENEEVAEDAVTNDEVSQGSPRVAERAKKDEHDFPSTTMVHAPKSPEKDEAGDVKSPSQIKNEEEAEAQIHHVARVTFEGDRSKGQLSFTTGSKIEAHSNQRGPWWLGRCGGRTGWFPASAVVPASEFLGSVLGSPVSTIGADESLEEEEEGAAQLSGDELNAVYDLIRNPSDPLEQDEDEGDSDEEQSSSPAKNRWLDGGSGKRHEATPSLSRDDSPPPSRLDPSQMAGLSERLYQSDDGATPQSPLSNGDIASQGNLDQQKGTLDETLSKDEPTQVKSADRSMNDATAISQAQSLGRGRSGKAKDSVLKANETRSEPHWRAVRDPKSGLVYYYHTGTRETTWERPPEYSARRLPTKGKSLTSTKKEKSKGRGKGIMGFLTKITKHKSEAEGNVRVQKSPNSAAQGADHTLKKVDAAKVESHTETKLDTPREANLHTPIESKPQDEPRQTEKLHMDEPRGTLAVEDEAPQKDFWLSLDDAVSRSDESEQSEASEGTETSIFSKRNIKTAVGKWTGKITEKLNSPPNRPYETLNDSLEQAKSMPESLAIDQLDQPSANPTSNNEPPRTKEEPKAQNQSEGANHGGDIPEAQGDRSEEPGQLGEKPNKEVPQDVTTADNTADMDKAIVAEDDAEANHDGPNNQIRLSDPTAKAKYVEETKKAPSKGEANRKKSQWRHAIDAATGRTYYYIKGSQKVTWEKPEDL